MPVNIIKPPDSHSSNSSNGNSCSKWQKMSWQCVCSTWKGREGQWASRGSGGVKDLGTDEFTSLSKWNDIVVNLGATKSNNNERTNVGQDKTNSKHDGDKEASRERKREREERIERGGKGLQGSWMNNNETDKVKQQQIACPSALDATQYTHSYLLLSGSRCNVQRRQLPLPPTSHATSAALMKAVSELTVPPVPPYHPPRS